MEALNSNGSEWMVGNTVMVMEFHQEHAPPPNHQCGLWSLLQANSVELHGGGSGYQCSIISVSQYSITSVSLYSITV